MNKTLQEIEILIANGKIEDAIRSLLLYCSNKYLEYQQDLILLSSQINRTNIAFARGLNEHFLKEDARITLRLIQIVSELKQIEGVNENIDDIFLVLCRKLLGATNIHDLQKVLFELKEQCGKHPEHFGLYSLQMKAKDAIIREGLRNARNEYPVYSEPKEAMQSFMKRILFPFSLKIYGLILVVMLLMFFLWYFFIKS